MQMINEKVAICWKSRYIDQYFRNSRYWIWLKYVYNNLSDHAFVSVHTRMMCLVLNRGKELNIGYIFHFGVKCSLLSRY